MVILTKEELNEMLREEAKAKREYFDYQGEEEIDGLLYSRWLDTRNGEQYVCREIRSVHMGFNSNEEGTVEKLIEIVEREGACKASWGVTGRTMHSILASQLAQQLQQYDFEIGYNYECIARKK